MERKEYEYKGTVTISTEEYSDLIRECSEQERNADEYRSKYWKEQSQTSDLQKQIKGLENRIKKLENFINATEERRKDYLNYVAQEMVGVEEE